MWQGSDGRPAMSIGSDTFAVGDIVASCRYFTHGQVVWIEGNIMAVVWGDGTDQVIYPTHTNLLRKLYPWERDAVR